MSEPSVMVIRDKFVHYADATPVWTSSNFALRTLTAVLGTCLRHTHTNSKRVRTVIISSSEVICSPSKRMILYFYLSTKPTFKPSGWCLVVFMNGALFTYTVIQTPHLFLHKYILQYQQENCRSYF